MTLNVIFTSISKTIINKSSLITHSESIPDRKKLHPVHQSYSSHFVDDVSVPYSKKSLLWVTKGLSQLAATNFNEFPEDGSQLLFVTTTIDKRVYTIRSFFPFFPLGLPLLNVKILNLMQRQSLSMKGSTLKWGRRASIIVGTWH